MVTGGLNLKDNGLSGREGLEWVLSLCVCAIFQSASHMVLPNHTEHLHPYTYSFFFKMIMRSCDSLKHVP
jgi:hypothetical protein